MKPFSAIDEVDGAILGAVRIANKGSYPLHQWRTDPSPFVIDVFAQRIVRWLVSTSDVD